MTFLVAVIDDDKAYQFISKKYLQLAGRVDNLLQFYDGLEAINYFKANERESEKLPDLVFLDINMPYLDGWQFLDQLCKLELAKDQITFYIVTSSPNREDIEKANNYSSVKGYKVKPITREIYIGLIEQTIQENFKDDV